jgi:hypothetical protein
MEVYKCPPFSGIKNSKETPLAIMATNLPNFPGAQNR